MCELLLVHVYRCVIILESSEYGSVKRLRLVERALQENYAINHFVPTEYTLEPVETPFFE